MLQECDRPSPWTPNPNDAIQDLSGIRDTLDIHDTQITDLEYFRDTLNPVKVVDFTRSGDSLYLDLSNGQTFAVRDSFLTEAEIQDMVDVNRSWLLKDGGVPDNATDTVFRDGVAVIEREVYDRFMSGDQDKYVWDGESDDPVFFQYVQDQSGNDMAGQGLAPNLYYAIVLLNSENPTEFESIQMHLGSGIVFLNYGQGNRIGDPTYLLGVDASGYIKEVRPTSGIDTIIHLGDSVFFDFDDKTFTIRDSVRSDADIIALIESHRIFQQLGRSGDFITLTDGGQVLDLHLKDAIHTGDSIRLIMSDGRTFSVRDSSLSVDAVRDMIIEEIPETVFYVKQGDVTAPVNWGDVVELKNGTVNVNMPTKVKMIDSLNALEVCIWQVIDRTVVDTIYDQFIEFNGTNSSYGERAGSSTPRVPIELPFSFRFSFNDLTNMEQAILSNGGETGNAQFTFRLNNNGDFWFRNGGRNVAFPISDLQEGYVHEIEVRQVDDDVGVFLDGVLKGTMSSIASGMGVTHIARQSSNNRPFNGRLYEIKSPGGGLPIDEGSGDKLFGPGGIEYDINNATWGVDTVIQVVEVFDTLFQCDTIYLSDIFISDATFENDTLKISRNDGKLFAIEIQASGGDGIDTMYSTSDSLYIITSTGRTLSAGVAKGDKGDGLEYHWDGTRLGVRVENSGDPFVYVGLKGDKGDTGDDGREVELRVDSEMIQWRYVGDNWQNLLPLSALKGEKGDTGPGLEYAWDDTKLGVRVEGSGDPFVYVDLKGEKGDPGDVVGDINIYKDDGVINGQRTATIAEDADLLFDMKDNSSFEIHTTNFGNQFRITEAINSIVMTAKESNNSGRRYTSEKKVLPTHTDTYTKVYQGPTEVKSSRLVTDTVGVRMEMANSREVDFLPGKKYFLTPLGTGNYVVWDTIKIEDIGITPSDTARWGESGGGDYTLEMNGWETHLRDESGASKGFFQIGGTQGIEVHTEPNNNRYRVGISNDFFPNWSMGVSNNALQLRKDNQTQSAVGFIGTGGIVIQSTGTSMTIDGSSISGGTQSLSFNSSQRRTSLSQGGGSFTINGGSNIDVSLSANGAYTISTSGGSTQEL